MKSFQNDLKYGIDKEDFVKSQLSKYFTISVMSPSYVVAYNGVGNKLKICTLSLCI